MTAAETPKATKAPTPAKQLEAWIKDRDAGRACGWYGINYAHRHLYITLAVEGTMPPNFMAPGRRGRELKVDLLPVSTLGARLSAMLDEIDGLELLPRMYGIWALREVLRDSELVAHPAFASAVAKKASYRLAYELEHLHNPRRWAGDRPHYFEMRHLRRDVLAALGDEDLRYWFNRVHHEVFAGLDDAPQELAASQPKRTAALVEASPKLAPQATTTTTTTTTTETTPQTAPAPSAEPVPVEVEAARATATATPATAPLVQAPQDPHAEACDWIRSLLETSGDKREVLPSWDRWCAHQSLPAPLETALGLALRYRVAHQLHTASPVEDQRTHRRREQGLWDATLKSLDLAAALVAAPLDEDDPQRVREERAKRREEIRQYLIAAHAPDPQEDQAPAPPTLADVLTPSLPVLKRCASTARGSVCGVEAHTEDEVERLFGWRWIGSPDTGREVPQGVCRACKSALNKASGKARTARRSQPAAPDLRQADLLQELPPPPPRPDYFARLRSICGLVIDGQWIGEGITTSRPPKLEAGDPERLVVTCEAGALRCALSPLGEWTVQLHRSPKAPPSTIPGWTRASAVVCAALGVGLEALTLAGYVESIYEVHAWVEAIDLARTKEVKP